MKSWTIQHQFKMWTILLVAVPSLLIMTIYTVCQIRIAKQNNLELISQQVEFQERLIEYWLMERLDEVRRLSRMAEIRSLDTQHIERMLVFIQQGNKNFDSLSYIDREGVFRVSTLSKSIQSPLAANQPYFQAAVAGQEYISDVVIGRNSGRPIINFSAPVYDDAGAYQGLILGSVRTTTLENLLHDNWVGQTGEILLVNHEGVMLTEPRHVSRFIAKGLIEDTAKMKLRLTDDALRKIRLGENGTASWINHQDKQVLGAYRYMPERDWTLIGSLNEAELLAPIYTQLAIMAVATLLVILLMLPMANWLTKHIRQPIDWLIGQAYLVAAENYQLVGGNEKLGGMPRELGTLCNMFVSMSRTIEHTVGLLKEKETSLESKVVEIQEINAMLEEEVTERQRTQEELQQLNAQLEERVSARTKQLQKINQKLQTEIVERQVTQETLKKMSITDALTGLNNHGFIIEGIEKKIIEANKYLTPLSLVMFDLDHFKKVNDTYGHLEGDQVLQEVAACLKANIREQDLLGRYGGEEFALILPNTDLEQAYDLAERLRIKVSEQWIGAMKINITTSGGVAQYEGEGVEEFIRRADQNLYHAKASGRNRIAKDTTVDRLLLG